MTFHSPPGGGRRRAFTLVEVLMAAGIIVVLATVLVSTLSKARQSAVRAQCLSNLHNLGLAQTAYAAANEEKVVAASSSSHAQGSWVAALEPYFGQAAAPADPAGTPPPIRAHLARRCPADLSPAFDTTQPDGSPDRTSSYGVNNYVSPTHTPSDAKVKVRTLLQVRNPERVVHFVELAEGGSYATSDHIHVQQFYLAGDPDGSAGLASEQMAVGRHGGKRGGWDGVSNYGFLDGHAESRALRDVYTDPDRNQFNPAVAR